MKKMFSDNVGLHVLALVLALALWFFVKSTSVPLRQVDSSTRRFAGVTIETRNRSAELELVRPISQTTTLNVRAPQEVLDRLTAQDLVAYVDLRALREGTHELNIRVDLPAGVEVLSANPPRVQVALEEIITTQVPVSLALSGQVPEGFFAAPGTVEPATVVVTGGRSVVGSLAPFVIVLDVTNLTNTLTSSVPLGPYNAQGQLLQLGINPQHVQYRQPIYPVKSVPIMILTEGGFAQGVTDIQFEYEPSAAVVAGSLDTLEDIAEVVVLINTANIVEDTVGEFVPAIPQGAYLVSPPSLSIRMIVVSEP